MRACEIAGDAYRSVPDDWEGAVQAALAEAVEYLATQPASLECGSSDDRERALAALAEMLAPGYEASPNPPPRVVSEAIAGAVYEIIHQHAASGCLAALPQSLPDLTTIALSPFLGKEAARKVAARAG